MRIATMEAMHEDTPTMILFFNLLNEVLQKVSGKPKYKFNPCRFYVYVAGCNKNAISRVFGRDALNRTVTCQWHFLQCVLAKAMQVKERHRKTFRKLCRRWIAATTRSEYDSISAALRTLCEKSRILDWFLWWDEHKFHIVRAFRGFNLSGLSLAESGQSGMKPKTRKKLRLIDAAYKDCSQMMRQDEMYKAYIGNISKEIGKGLSKYRKGIAGPRKTEQEDMLMRCSGAMSMPKQMMKKIVNNSSLQILLGTEHHGITLRKTRQKRGRKEFYHRKKQICQMLAQYIQRSRKKYHNLLMMTLFLL